MDERCIFFYSFSIFIVLHFHYFYTNFFQIFSSFFLYCIEFSFYLEIRSSPNSNFKVKIDYLKTLGDERRCIKIIECFMAAIFELLYVQ